MILSVVIAVLVAVGATFGGSLVFEHGFNVETAGDSPVWHKSDRDVFPGQSGPANSPAYTVNHLPPALRMPVYVGVGTGDGRYLENNEQFISQLRRLGWNDVSFDVGHGPRLRHGRQRSGRDHVRSEDA